MNRIIEIVSMRNSIIAWIVICTNSSKVFIKFFKKNAFAMFFLPLHISPFMKTPSGELLCGFLCNALCTSLPCLPILASLFDKLANYTNTL